MARRRGKGRSKHGPSIKAPAAYEHIKRKTGGNKSRAAAISNALYKKTGGGGVRHSPGHRSSR